MSAYLHSAAFRREQGARAAALTSDQRRGLVFHPTWQRTIVITFDSPEEAEAWDELDDEVAFAVLADSARRRRLEDQADERYVPQLRSPDRVGPNLEGPADAS